MKFETMKTRKIILLGIIVALMSGCGRSYEFHLKKGVEYVRSGNLEPAIKHLTKAIQLNSDSDVAYFWRGRVFVQMEKYDDAIADITMAIKLNDNVAVYYSQRAIIYRQLGELDLAIEDFTSAIKLNENFPQIHIRRGLVYVDLSNNEKARVDFEKSIKINPDDLGAYAHLAVIYMLEGQMKSALELFNYVIDRNSNYFDRTIGIGEGEVYFMRAGIFADLGKHDEAIADLKTAIDLGCELAKEVLKNHYGIKILDRFPQFFLRGGELRYDFSSDTEKIKSDLKRAIEINPDDLSAYVLLVEINILEKQMELALENINYVIAKNPDYFDESFGIKKGRIYFVRAVIYASLNEHQKAIDDLKIAVNMDFEGASAILKNHFGIDYP